MRILCVAEKPSISKSITQILSGGRFTVQNTHLGYIKNYVFDYPQANASIVFTCVTGHLTAHDFTDAHRKWHSCDPVALFDAPIEAHVPENNRPIERNLINQARHADMLMIWTDCDREGEHIGTEIANVCRKVKRSITVKRARFSAIIAQQIHRAAQHPVDLDLAQADAVQARILLDLKVGAAFTRMQTLSFQAQFQALKENIVSYGPCQFPTLGFVVQRYIQVKNFVPEPFWYIFLSLKRRSASGEEQETTFNWKRGHLFDEDIAIALYAYVLERPVAKVKKVSKNNTKKWKPLPLTTVELQKAGSRLLKLAPKKVLDIAEKLYQQGFISYPRTETDQFDPQFDFMFLIQKQTADPSWGAFATSLQEGGFNAPRKGKHDDKAHPPIHPTAHAGQLTGDEKKVYEYITRRFLACCSKDAEGFQTTVEVECNGEFFSASGLLVLQRNYLDVYPYDKWSGHQIPEFVLGEEFQPTVCELREGLTTKPHLLTEADLVALMDKNGIGTDATIAQHIATIVDRGYVIERMEGSTKYLVPSKLGIGLVEGYNQIGLDKSVSKPQLRRENERLMVQVCERRISKEAMLQQSLNQYKEMYAIVRNQWNMVVESVRRYLEDNGDEERQNRNALPADNGRPYNDHDDDGGGGGDGDGRGGGRGEGNSGNGGQNGGRRRDRPCGSRTTAIIGQNVKNQQKRTTAEVNAIAIDDGMHNEYPPIPPPRSKGSTKSFRQSKLSSSAGSSIPPPSTSPPAVNQITMCECGLPVSQKTTTSGVSKGKQYYTCARKSCEFWEWADSSGQGSGGDIVIPSKRSYSQTNEVLPRICRCNLPSIQRAVTKDTPNQGRKFWRCPNGLGPDNNGTDCGYFEWDDEPPRTAQIPTTSSNGIGTSAGGARSSGSCFKCNQEGHWANDCPSVEGGLNKRPRSFGTSTNWNTNDSDTSANVTCYKCNQRGHYSNACPAQGSASELTKSTRVETSTNTGACYKCGEEGHWANFCTSVGSTSATSRSATMARRARGSRYGSTRGGRGSRSNSTNARTGSTKRERGKRKTSSAAADGQ